MNTAYRAWRAGFVRRWHTNFDLCDTVDYDAGHQGRVVILILSFFPEAASRNLLIRAVTHDQGEVAVGDVASPAKNAQPLFRQFLHDLEGKEILRQMLPQPELTEFEQTILRLFDWLDAWLWMTRHKPHLATQDDWLKELTTATELAKTLEVEWSFRDLIHAASPSAYEKLWGE